MVESLEQDFGHNLIKEAMGLWAVSRNGLTEEEMVELLSPAGEERLTPMVWSQFFLRIRNYLKGINSSGGVLGFFHREMYEARIKSICHYGRRGKVITYETGSLFH